MNKISGTHIQVINTDPSDNPHCLTHGPALLMRQTFDDGSPEETFFACSANRNKAKCPIRTRTKPVDEVELSKKYEERIGQYRRVLSKISSLPSSQRGFCGQCACLVLPIDITTHEKHDSFQCDLSDEDISCPTKLLAPLDNDTKEAQYFFDEKTLICLGNVCHTLGIRKVICVGAPRLHEYLRFNRKRLQIESVLLDLDHRLEQFYSPEEFFMFNMFNNHFMDGKAREKEFNNFLEDNQGGKVLLFTDPPFGCRTEPLALTIKTIAKKYQLRNSLAHSILPCMWIFPYFMETYIHQVMPEMQMAAYRVNYTNHRSYHSSVDRGGRKQGSPIRLYTNIPLDQIPLPADEGYSKCIPCKQWRAGDDKHCAKCADCPSKNGSLYIHCKACAMCVKPSYKHCLKCGRCTQVVGHSCIEYKKHVTCWICLRKGHNETECKEWLSGDGAMIFKKYKSEKKKTGKVLQGRMCLVCGDRGHNERRCPKRGVRLQEIVFMQEAFNIFSK